MSEDKDTRWRRMSREQRERLVSAVVAIQTGLAEALHPEHVDFLHPWDRQALQREQRRRGGEPPKVRHRPKAAGD